MGDRHMTQTPDEDHGIRVSLALTGAIAGLALWLLLDKVPDLLENARLVLMLTTVGMGFFGVLLGLLGPARLTRALLAAVVLSLPAAGLFVWASFRFDDPGAFVESGHSVLALMSILVVGTPFAAACLSRQGGWKDYGLLFDLAWTITIRYVAAGLFVGIVWAVLMLSNALLSLVGVTIIDQLIDLEPAPWLLSGLALGLGLAIVHELRDYVSPFLIIQLLRVLLPFLLVVLAIFIVALPFQGLSGLFGGLSPAATLASVAFAGITLVTSAVHMSDDAAVQGALLRRSAQALAVLVAVPAALAVYAVVIRVSTYGLTPDRVAALSAALIVLAYAVCYAVAVLMRGGWTARIRNVNLALALGLIGVSALWLTPVLNAERMSVSSQVARAEAGAEIEKLPLWEMAHDWGIAGIAGLDRLRGLDDREDHAALVARIAEAEAIDYKYQFTQGAPVPDQGPLDGRVTLRPVGMTLPEGAFDRLSPSDRTLIAQGCDRTLPEGGAACVIVLADYDPQNTYVQGIGFFLTDNGWVRAMGFELREGSIFNTGNIGGDIAGIDAAFMQEVVDGAFEIKSRPRNVLDVGGKVFFPDN